MRRLFSFASLLLTSIWAAAQPVSVDLSLSNNYFSTATGADLDANLIATGQVVRLNVTVGNFVSGVIAPAGHFRIRIGLGNGMKVNPGFNLATAPLSAYFNWSIDNSGAQQQIVGLSVAPLPSDFAQEASFELKAMTATTSTASFNFLIANPPGTTTPVSDPASANNSCANTYTITAAAPLPVNFASIGAAKNGCEVALTWRVEAQSNLARYEVEASRDNITYAKLGQVAAQTASEYRFAFVPSGDWNVQTLYLRVKSVDNDGSFRYSKTVSVNGTCTGKMVLGLYPNPVSEGSVVTVLAREGAFNGKYKVSVVSSAGQVVQKKELNLAGVRSFPLSVRGLAAGKYHINLVDAGGSQLTLDFEKL